MRLGVANVKKRKEFVNQHLHIKMGKCIEIDRVHPAVKSYTVTIAVLGGGMIEAKNVFGGTS
ncbi:hypothetical protein J31TS6_16550 [Brevibacillus reuszeri]|nr:hypothetical protein J31TS6_16550 [Brevibacillus reuszeri]